MTDQTRKAALKDIDAAGLPSDKMLQMWKHIKTIRAALHPAPVPSAEIAEAEKRAEELKPSSVCPVCGLDRPHAHHRPSEELYLMQKYYFEQWYIHIIGEEKFLQNSEWGIFRCRDWADISNGASPYKNDMQAALWRFFVATWSKISELKSISAEALTAMAAENDLQRLTIEAHNDKINRITAENAGLRDALKNCASLLKRYTDPVYKDSMKCIAYREAVDALAAHGEGKS